MMGAARAFLVNGNAKRDALRHLVNSPIALQCYNSLRTESTRSAVGKNNWTGDGSISHTQATKLLRLVDMEALKSKLGVKTKEVIAYSELLKACESLGVAKSPDEAASFARALDEAGVILLFRDKVYLHPQKVVDQVRKSVHLALTTEDDPKRDEFNKLQEEKKKLDKLAHKQVVCILWSGLGIIVMQIGLFFRLTFWEFSWDVMEPVTFFATATGIIISYGYFLITSRDPTYRDFMERLFLSRQRKVFQKHGFDIQRFKELQERCKFSHAKMSLKL